MKITIRVQPNAKTSEIIGCVEGIWKIKLKAPATEGKANDALVRFIAKHSSVSPSEIRIIRGKTSRTKLIELPDDAQIH